MIKPEGGCPFVQHGAGGGGREGGGGEGKVSVKPERCVFNPRAAMYLPYDLGKSSSLSGPQCLHLANEHIGLDYL